MTAGSAVLPAARGESRVLRAACAIGIAALVLLLVLRPPTQPVNMLAMLVGVALLGVLPRLPKAAGLAGLPLCLAATWPAGYLPKDIGVAMVLFCLFLAIGYAWPTWVGAVAAAAYALVESACTVWLGARGAAACCVRELLGLWLAAAADDGGPGPAASSVPAGPWPVFVAGTLVSGIVSGFAVILGYAFSARAQTSDQLERTQAMLGRLTREQELAHMIHDSVANDASVIAMLAWRAKSILGESGRDGGGHDDGTGAPGAGHDGSIGGDADSAENRNAEISAMLDAIYDRAHQALDRTHEVIDVLNGTRSMDGGPAPEPDRRRAAVGPSVAMSLPCPNGLSAATGPSAPSAATNLSAPTGPSPSTVPSAATGWSVPAGPAPAAAPSAAGPLDGRLERLCEDQDRTLRMLGFQGRGRVEGAGPDRVPARTRRVVIELVQEIYANIVRHGMTGADGCYAVLIELDADAARITSTNRIADGPSRISQTGQTSQSSPTTRTKRTRHGRGLGLHRAAVESLGGTMATAIQDGTWVLSARIPLAGRGAGAPRDRRG
ncbi:hypothetical protein H7U32_07770 [Bifidobacterium pullorum subsp. saeculare]|uniref:Uncharacterized protein n=1 Tax=Bifidobacterium pullorum subsp. saeculare TaxID=78257 RepID=A0A939B8T0_9BIFI|nr:hypothetical protein [Bifidobacterium pullorum]MBM6700187.1 hypothetical protein [Bifidobacterium pullorum subsp. saeculare]